MRRFKQTALVAVVVSAVISQAAQADKLGDCLRTHIKNFEQPQIFSKTGRVTCPPADMAGFPPRERRYNRNGTISYTAPEGYVIADFGDTPVRVTNVGGDNGKIGTAQISRNGRQASLPISCEGKAIKQGSAWQEAQIEGRIMRPINDAKQKEWLLECARQ